MANGKIVTDDKGNEVPEGDPASAYVFKEGSDQLKAFREAIGYKARGSGENKAREAGANKGA